MSRFIDQHPGSTISYSYELCPISQLEPLLQHHPSFDCFTENHMNGIDYPINNINDENRVRVLEATIEQGNHKSVLKDDERPHVTKLMTQDVELGCGIPISIDCIKKIPGAEVYPVG